jgi:hypothetical protein
LTEKRPIYLGIGDADWRSICELVPVALPIIFRARRLVHDAAVELPEGSIFVHLTVDSRKREYRAELRRFVDAGCSHDSDTTQVVAGAISSCESVRLP